MKRIYPDPALMTFLIMTLDDWRSLLYYPLGILPTFFFAFRLFMQWYQSEQRKQSYVNPTFWKLSLAGNALLMLHFFVQVQYPFALLQAGNATISWRNLNLMNPQKRYSLQTTLLLLFSSMTLLTLAFFVQGYFSVGEPDWIRTPVKLFDNQRIHHSWSWHIIGTLGGILFASRFWVQWWQAEWSKRSELNRAFWWLSISGSVISLIYFTHLGDTINILLYSFGIIPYFRNLILLKRVSTKL